MACVLCGATKPLRVPYDKGEYKVAVLGRGRERGLKGTAFANRAFVVLKL